MIIKCFSVFRLFRLLMPTYKHQHSRLRPSAPHALNAASSGNPGKSVVAVAAALGSETAEVLGTQNFFIRGTRAFGPVQHAHSPRQPSASSRTLFSN